MKEQKEEDVAVISNVLLHASSSYQLSLILITIIFVFVELAVGQPAFIGHVEGYSCMISPFFPHHSCYWIVIGTTCRIGISDCMTRNPLSI